VTSVRTVRARVAFDRLRPSGLEIEFANLSPLMLSLSKYERRDAR
jgi:hypothetical protein